MILKRVGARCRAFADLLADPDVRPYLHRLLSATDVDRPSVRSEPAYVRGSTPGSSGRASLWPSAPPLLPWGVCRSDGSAWSLTLASAVMPAQSNLRLPWLRHFSDPEDEDALHRFAWLLPWLVARSHQELAADETWRLVEDSIANWLAVPVLPSAAWHPYTISERMMNWTLAALALGREVRQESALARALSDHADRLAANLEYYGETFTGNHLSNNGRALYVVGLVTGSSIATCRGRTILVEEGRRLFREPWFLREGSSHYQFLITRNYVEALWAARTAGDQETAAVLSPHVRALVDGCCFFLVQTGPDAAPVIPLIGDISPDCTPQWLLGVPDVGARLVGQDLDAIKTCLPSSGWCELFKNSLPTLENGRLSRASHIVSDEWARLDRDGWTVFAHANPEGSPRGHAHQDTGAVVVFKQGRPVLVDTGRLHYVNDEVGRWGHSPAAHSTLTVDGLDPAPSWHWLYPPTALSRLTGGPPLLNVDDSSVSIAHKGFARRSAVSESKRTIRSCGPSRLEITDQLHGQGQAHLRISFHLDGPCTIARRDQIIAEGPHFALRTVALSDVVHRYGSPNDREQAGPGWAATAYGSAQPITSLVVEGRVSLPWQCTTVVEARHK